MGRLASVWLATALVLSTATQLRPESAPVGVGELMMAAWIGFVTLSPAKPKAHFTNPLFRGTLGFWVAALVLNTLGAGAAEAMQLGDHQYFGREMAALLLVMLTTVTWLQLPNIRAEARQLGAQVLHVGVGFVFVTFLYAFLVSPTLGPISFWYSVRFRGFSHNPNQLALLLVGMPFVAAYLLTTATDTRASLRYGLLGIGAVAIGLTTLSDALLVSWVGGAAVLGILALAREALRPGVSLFVRGSLIIMLPLTLLAGAIIGEASVVAHVERAMENMYDDGGQGASRLTLWGHGIDALRLSPIVGLGPGPKSGFTRPLQGAEAHNTFIDWGASTGVLGLVLLGGFLSVLGWRAWHTGYLILFSLQISLVVFAVFHFVVRHPIYWVYALMSVLMAPLAERKTVRAAGLGLARSICSPSRLLG